MDDFEYKLHHTHLIKNTVFTEDYQLLSIYGYKVGQKVTFSPELLKAFRQYHFSDSFLQVYEAGVFEISYYQTNLIHSSIHDSRFCEIGLDVTDRGHQNELVHFSNQQKKLVRRSGWNTTPPFFCISLECIQPAFEFIPVPLTAYTAPF